MNGNAAEAGVQPDQQHERDDGQRASDVVVPLLNHVPAELKSVGLRSCRVLWDDRGWPARLGLIGVTIGVGTFGGKAAGIATMGRGIGIPLWALLGASGTFLGTPIEELSPAQEPTTTYGVIEAERLAAPMGYPPDRGGV